MWHVVMKLEVAVDDRVIGMVELQEMLERSSGLFVLCFDIVDGHGWNVDGLAGVSAEEAGEGERIGEGEG